jgi:hypothetical protein
LKSRLVIGIETAMIATHQTVAFQSAPFIGVPTSGWR